MSKLNDYITSILNYVADNPNTYKIGLCSLKNKVLFYIT